MLVYRYILIIILLLVLLLIIIIIIILLLYLNNIIVHDPTKTMTLSCLLYMYAVGFKVSPNRNGRGEAPAAP